MSISMQPWPLIVVCALLCPALLFSSTHSTPIVFRSEHEPNPCTHNSIAELIRKSPVIVKALGAHIFTDDARTEEIFAAAARAGAAMAGRGAVNDDLKWHNVQNNFFSSATLQTATKEPKASNRAPPEWQQSEQQPLAATAWQRSSQSAATLTSSVLTTTMATATTNSARLLDESILITLTPETIYKGASLLKMTPGRENAARGGDNARGDVGDLGHNAGYGSGSGDSATTESAYQYEGQLNATLQPLSCFDGNLLKMLPAELIIFGKLINVQQQQQQQLPSQLHTTQQLDFLSISINGLHRWTPQFENRIWKHLAEEKYQISANAEMWLICWDDWSDFTLCSVTCGKGVQQRFRRCLLDNPMVNFNMQLNLNVAATDDDDDEDEDVVDDDAMLSSVGFEDTRLVDNVLTGFTRIESDDAMRNDKKDPWNHHDHKSTFAKKDSEISQEYNGNAAGTNNAAYSVAPMGADAPDTAPSETATLNAAMYDRIIATHKFNSLPVQAIATTNAVEVIPTKNDDQINDFKGANSIENKDAMRTFEGNMRVDDKNFFGGGGNDANIFDKFDNAMTKKNEIPLHSQVAATRRQRKRRKPTKKYSTMFCEGYNIEQRNCNTFECNDDISDLLKFYKKYAMPEDVAMQSSPVMPLAADSHTITTFTVGTSMAGTGMTASSAIPTMTTVNLANNNAPTTGATSATTNKSTRFGSGTDSGSGSGATNGVSFIFDAGAASALGSSLNIGETNTNAAHIAATVANSLPPSTTPANMGYIRSWRNTLNFTIMLTLRVRNDSKTATTIFSIRNATHNLYLESCKDGLRLYLERDSTTEMLPVKFNLYDYRWHQVAISIQNGDFISIYVDCSWTNSFVVSKRLYTLPLDADVEIGRGFNGELQQLLVLPDNQERQQCSNKRTSINEVKRYIIDTFIGDYGN